VRDVVKRIQWSRMVLVVATVVCTTTQSIAHNQGIPSRRAEAIVEFNASCMSEGLWTGSVALVGTIDRTVFRQAWGYTSVERAVELREDAIFDMASVTKPVATATALAICMDRGWVDISAPFTQYLPEYQGQLQGTVTVLDLARHISGFDNSKAYMKGGQVIENLLSDCPVRPPRQKYEYACINYILLGLIVENVSGASLSEFCKEHIFDPLSMQDTRWTPLPTSDTRVARSIFTPKVGVVSDNPARAAGRPVGNAGLFSTADDLGKFCRMILAHGTFGTNRLLSEKAIAAMSVKPDACSPLAFGWFVAAERNPPSLSKATLSHTGWTGNSIWIDPAQQCFAIVLTNRTGDHGRAIQARIELAERVLREVHKELRLGN